MIVLFSLHFIIICLGTGYTKIGHETPYQSPLPLLYFWRSWVFGGIYSIDFSFLCCQFMIQIFFSSRSANSFTICSFVFQLAKCWCSYLLSKSLHIWGNAFFTSVSSSCLPPVVLKWWEPHQPTSMTVFDQLNSRTSEKVWFAL